MDYDWPGNVRELRNVIEYAFVLCREGLIEPEHLSPRVRRAGHTDSFHTNSTKQARHTTELDFLNDASHKERDTLVEALRKCGGNRTEAARMLGVRRVTVWRRMKKNGVDQASRLH